MVRNHEQTYWIAWGEHSEERRRIRVAEQSAPLTEHVEQSTSFIVPLCPSGPPQRALGSGSAPGVAPSPAPVTHPHSVGLE